MHPRTRQTLQDFPPEKRAAGEASIARSETRRATPEGRADEEEVIRKVREEFPPLAIDPDLAAALAALRAERERQGLSLSDIAERTGIDRSTLSKLETGKVPNPTVSTLRSLAGALNKRLSWSLAFRADRHRPDVSCGHLAPCKIRSTGPACVVEDRP